MDIDDMTLGDGFDMSAALVTLGIVVAEDDGDDTVLLQVVDIRLRGHVERGQLLRSITLDGEFLLEVRQLAVVGLRDQHTPADVAARIDGGIGADIGDGMAVGIAADAIALTAIVVRLALIGCSKRQCRDMGLLVIGQVAICLCRDDLSDGVRRVAPDEG